MVSGWFQLLLLLDHPSLLLLLLLLLLPLLPPLLLDQLLFLLVSGVLVFPQVSVVLVELVGWSQFQFQFQFSAGGVLVRCSAARCSRRLRRLGVSGVLLGDAHASLLVVDQPLLPLVLVVDQPLVLPLALPLVEGALLLLVFPQVSVVLVELVGWSQFQFSAGGVLVRCSAARCSRRLRRLGVSGVLLVLLGDAHASLLVVDQPLLPLVLVVDQPLVLPLALPLVEGALLLLVFPQVSVVFELLVEVESHCSAARCSRRLRRLGVSGVLVFPQASVVLVELVGWSQFQFSAGGVLVRCSAARCSRRLRRLGVSGGDDAFEVEAVPPLGAELLQLLPEVPYELEEVRDSQLFEVFSHPFEVLPVPHVEEVEVPLFQEEAAPGVDDWEPDTSLLLASAAFHASAAEAYPPEVDEEDEGEDQSLDGAACLAGVA